MLLCPNCGDKVFPSQAKHETKVVPTDHKNPILKQATQLRTSSRSRKTTINPDDKQDIIDLGYKLEYAEEIS
jgi:hypothetical protein